MKKKATILVMIIIVIVASTVILSKVFTKDNNKDFPHNKQAMYKIQGSMDVTQGKEFQLKFRFVDEYKLSEMASSDNIKKIDIKDKDNKVLDILKWELESLGEDSDCITRNLKIQTVLKEIVTYKPTTLSITYKDDKIKSYPIGNFKITCDSEENQQKKSYPMYYNVESCKIKTFVKKDESPYSAIAIYVNNLANENVTIEKIDLGIECFAIDKDKFSYHFMDKYDMNYITNEFEEKAKNNGDSWIEGLNNRRVVKEFEPQNISIKINKNSYEEAQNGKGTYIILPFTEKEKVKNDSILMLNIKLFIDDNGEKKEVFPFKPTILFPETFDTQLNRNTSRAYLKEAGI